MTDRDEHRSSEPGIESKLPGAPERAAARGETAAADDRAREAASGPRDGHTDDQGLADTDDGPDIRAGDARGDTTTVSVRAGSGGGRALGAFALCLALLAVMATGFLWWQYRQFYVALDDADAATRVALQDTRANLRALRDRLDEQTEQLADTETRRRARLDELERALGQLPRQFATLQARLDAVQGGSFDARAAWLRAQAEYYLELANAELTLAGRWDSAIAALELADRTLRDLANPRFNVVRSAIADELLALRAVRRPDLEGLILSLGRLTERTDTLPLQDAAPDNFRTDVTGLEDAEPGLGRLWLGLKNALGSIVRVERRESTPALALTAAEQRLTRRQLALELELARLAALRGEPAGFDASLTAARELLLRDFATQAPAVEGALELLEDLAAFEIAPPRPDISGSLNALRNIGTD